MKNFEYTVRSGKTFDAAVDAVEQRAAEKGFSVLHTHDFAGTLAKKGFQRDPLKVVEICNARYANEALKKDVSVALMLPCPIAVYVKDGTTFISTMRPSVLSDLYPDAALGDIAHAVEKTVLEIIEDAK